MSCTYSWSLISYKAHSSRTSGNFFMKFSNGLYIIKSILNFQSPSWWPLSNIWHSDRSPLLEKPFPLGSQNITLWLFFSFAFIFSFVFWLSFYVSLFCFICSLSFPKPSFLYTFLLSSLPSLQSFLFPHLLSHPLCSLSFSLLPFTSTPSSASLAPLWISSTGSYLFSYPSNSVLLLISVSALLYPYPYSLLRDSLSLLAWNVSHILVTSIFVPAFRIFPLTSRQTYPTALFMDWIEYSTDIANLTCLVLLSKASLFHFPLHLTLVEISSNHSDTSHCQFLPGLLQLTSHCPCFPSARVTNVKSWIKIMELLPHPEEEFKSFSNL